MLTQTQLEERRAYVGASDVPAILGLSRWSTPFDVYAEKVMGRDPKKETTYAMRRGHALEPLLIDYLGEQTGLSFRHNTATYEHRIFPWARATPDAEAESDDGVVVADAKVVSGDLAADWFDEAGDPAMPEYVLVQVHWQMIVRGATHGIAIADIFREYEPRIERVTLDEELSWTIQEEVQRFWVDHVLAKKPPAIDGSEGSARLVRRLYPKATGEQLKADPGTEELAREYIRAEKAAKRAEAELAAAETVLKAKIGDAHSLEGFGWRATWGNRKGSISYKSAIEALLPHLRGHSIDLEEFRGADSRQFRFTYTKAKEGAQ